MDVFLCVLKNSLKTMSMLMVKMLSLVALDGRQAGTIQGLVQDQDGQRTPVGYIFSSKGQRQC